MSFPKTRLRRTRRTDALRRMVRETRLSRDALVMPLFVRDGEGAPEPIASMPGCSRHTLASLAVEARAVRDAGVPGVILFGIPAVKDATGSAGYAPDGIVARAIRALKRETPELLVWADVCLCEYTDHGHCGVIDGGEVVNDATLPLLAKAATVYADAGADIIAPSDMMDGRVGAIRSALDAARHENVPIVSYAAKYASAFYGPFRDAAGSTPAFGDRRAYQMDPANVEEALREVAADLDEGADIVMVKPALAYLDVIRRVKDRFGVPVAAYNVSGEYAMIRAAAERGWIDEERAILESLTAIRRAGADIILTYFAKEVAPRLP
ncbi:MAG: porphobilinogen synthase [bacterium]